MPVKIAKWYIQLAKSSQEFSKNHQNVKGNFSNFDFAIQQLLSEEAIERLVLTIPPSLFFTWSHWNNSSYHSSHFYFTLFHNNSVKNLKLEKFHFKFIRNSKLLVQEEVQNYNSTVWILFLLGSTPCKVEQPLRDMKL